MTAAPLVPALADLPLVLAVARTLLVTDVVVALAIVRGVLQ